ncbi:MAG: MltA domain-containing protein [Cyanobacteria bacterium P01_F01_bin.153]
MRSFFSRAGSVGASVAIALGSLGVVAASGFKLHPAQANNQPQPLLTAESAIGPLDLPGLKGGDPVPAPNPNAVAPDGQPLSRDVEVPLAAPTALTPGSSLGTDWQLFGNRGDRQNLLKSIDYSLRYMRTAKSVEVYRNYPVEEVTHDRVVRSLQRFRQLVVAAKSAKELQASVAREFDLYSSVGRDGRGEVYFTGYFVPVYRASRVRTDEFRYPLYRVPGNQSQWQQPYPTREELEGKDGEGTESVIKGQELFWLRDRMEAFLVHIQGSARLQLPDGSITSVGYAGNNGYPYVSVGGEIAKDGRLPRRGMTLPVMIRWFEQNPGEINNYLPRNHRFIFFQETNGAPAQGNLNVPVTADRSIATDRDLMPPGALALVNTSLPYVNGSGRIEYHRVNRFVLDQDTGSAMIGPGRADYFMGTGDRAGARAGVTGSAGRLYYLLLREAN